MSEFCIGCGQRAAQLHHVVYRQEVRRAGGDEKDERNLVPTCVPCHAGHHSYMRTFRLDQLPDSVFEFATELMGAGPAFNYLRRHYDGDDSRLNAVLDNLLDSR